MSPHNRKVLIVDKQIYYGGGETYKLDLAEILTAFGFEIVFATPAEGKFSARVQELGFSFVPFTPKSRFDVPGMIQFAKTMKPFRFDLIITSDSASWYAGIIIKKICRPAVMFGVVHISTLGTEQPFSPLKKFIIRILDKAWANAHTHVVSSTQYHADILINEGVRREKIKIIPNTVKRQEILKNISEEKKKQIKNELNIPENALVLSMFGRFGAGKDFNNLIDAIPLVLQNNKNVCFLLVGDGPDFDRMKRKAEKLNVSEFIRFPGFIKEEYYNYLNLADIFINSTIAEGVSYVVLDAMALGKPIVATSSGGIREAVKEGQNGILVPPKNPVSLAEGINALIVDSDRLNLFRKNAVTIQETDFSFEAMTKMLEDYLTENLPGFER